jgi:hypothetical protein
MTTTADKLRVLLVQPGFDEYAFAGKLRLIGFARIAKSR